MGERASHTPGTFSWTDLSTADPEGAKRFYGGLFGWEAEDIPLPDGGVYTMLRLGGRDAAAISAAREGQMTAWLSYITVDEWTGWRVAPASLAAPFTPSRST